MSVKNWFSRTCMLAFIICATLTVALQAKTPPKEPSGANAAAAPQSTQAKSSYAATHCYNKMRCTTQEMRKAAAAGTAKQRMREAALHPVRKSDQRLGPLVTGLTLDQLYWGMYPNYALSPLPFVDPVAATITGGLQKFVDQLPGIPAAVPDQTTFPGSDYYEIELIETTTNFHSALNNVKVRGYHQTNGGPAYSYLGPLIVAQANRPVRIKFTNHLATGTAGNLFIPTDLSYMGAGLGPDNLSPYLQNRATVHLHGGNTPWISDGTPHQWTVPVGETTTYMRGDSVQFVPDMWFDASGNVIASCAGHLTCAVQGATNDPGQGSLTFYYTNQQSARLMFYHDHAYGITRLNVYAGEAAGYLLQDTTEATLVTGGTIGTTVVPPGTIPADQIPLVIQDKTFVPQLNPNGGVYNVTIMANGQDYVTPQVAFSNPVNGTCTILPAGTATKGQITIGLPPITYNNAILSIQLSNAGAGCTGPPTVTITDAGGVGFGAVASSYMASMDTLDPTWDTSIYGGFGQLWFPHLYLTNQWPAAPDDSASNPWGRWDYGMWFWPPMLDSEFVVRPEIPCPTLSAPSQTCPGTPSVLAPAPAMMANGTTVDKGVGSTASGVPESFMDTPLVNGKAYPTKTLQPKAYRLRILNADNDRTLNLSLFMACGQYTPTTGAFCPAPLPLMPALTEVGMVPAVNTTGFPSYWPIDGRAGGVPDPLAAGPSWIQIGTEGGFLPAPVTIPPAPVGYETSLRSITVTNISTHSLLLGPAERADVIVDFSAFAGKTLILYNDAPAPVPAFDPRLDYYTGDPDQTSTGGAPTTLAGFGPNTRTVMQIVVAGTPAPFNPTPLNTALPAAFAASQPIPIIPERAYSATYNETLTNHYSRIQDQTVTFAPITKPVYGVTGSGGSGYTNPSVVISGTGTGATASAILGPGGSIAGLTLTNPGSGYTAIPSVVINDPTGSGATTAATITATLTYFNKTIQELFELQYGKMNATLGDELPFTSFNNQTTVPLGYVDPTTEIIQDSSISGTRVATMNDGTQIWKVVHNGVDTHAIHVHLMNIQLLNRAGWDGTVRSPEPNELGWKETVRMNPLEIDFVALRPIAQSLPWAIPDSVRLLDVTSTQGSNNTMMPAEFSIVDQFNNPVTTNNGYVNYGQEYVWHCHLLGHEENDMMRPIIFQVLPPAPSNLAAGLNGQVATASWTDNSKNETSFTLERATDLAFTQNIRTYNVPTVGQSGPLNLGTTSGGTITYPDPNPLDGVPTYYRVQALNEKATIYSAINPAFTTQASAWSQPTAILPTLTITASSANVTYGDPAPTITPSFSGFVNGDNQFTALTTQPTCTTTYTQGSPVSGSPYPATCSGAVSSKYFLVYVGGTVTVARPVLTVTANNASMTYGGTVPALTYIMTGFVNGENQGTATGGAPSITTTATSSSPAGIYTITAALGSLTAANYSFTFVNGTLTINKAVLTVTADNKSVVDGLPFPTFTASYTGFVNGDGVGVLGGSPSLTTTANQNSGPGTYPINAAQGTLTATNYTFTFVAGTLTITPSVAVITSPPKGSTLPGSTATFTWTKQSFATSYQLWVGTTSGAHDIATVGTTGLAATVTNLPTNGLPVYVTLYAYVSGVWSVKDTATYTASSGIIKAVITSPPKGSTLTSSSATFTWTAETGATSYQLWVGTAPGLHDIASKGTSNLSTTVTGLPTTGITLYVTLQGLSGGSWSVQDTATYTAFTIVKAVITSPAKGSTLHGSTVTFTWTAETGATSYQLWVGTAPGLHDIASKGTSNLSTTIFGLPTNGSQIYVTLQGLAGGSWSVQDTATYTTGP